MRSPTSASSALAWFDRGIEVNSASAPLHANRGAALRELRRSDAALASLDRALALAPAHAKAHANRAAVLLDLGRAHPDLGSLVTQLDIFRWGHAMVRPEVGARTGSGRLQAARASGRLHFAHSDLSGVSLFEEAFDHGVRAADEVLVALRPHTLGRAP